MKLEMHDVEDPEVKRRAIGNTFIRVFEEVASEHQDARFLVQGTLYPDIIESGTRDAARIKSHHNVGGLPDDMQFELVEPLRNLFKDEVRAIGEELGLAGIAALLAMLLWIVFRGLSVAIQTQDGFRKLLATGLMAVLAIQTIVIVGGTTRLMPLTGVPLPFLSYGGSSAIANYIIIALLLKISTETAEERT